MTPKRKAIIRGWLARGGPSTPAKELARELLAALDDEQKAHDETRRERDEAQAALVALREAIEVEAEQWDDYALDWDEKTTPRGICEQAALGIRELLTAAPATLAGQVEARVLRKAADRAHERHIRKQTTAEWLRALADEAERAK